ncbi:MAG: hypothetical protein JRJ19_13920, partial [Deltaproteobacteria bacterium]|nr:hypothetical protein [Deltaproteobacteria bacterium]
QKELVSNLEGLAKNKQELETSRQQSHRQLSQSEARIVEIDRSVVEWHGPEDDPASGLAADLETVTTQLSQGDIAPIAQRALEAYQLQIEALAYDSEEHQTAKIRRDELEHAQTRFQELKQAQAAFEPLQKGVEDLNLQVVEQEEAVSDLAQQHQQSTLHLKTLEEGVSDLSILVQEVNRLREEEITAHRRVATAEQSVAVLNVLHQQREKISTDRTEATVLIQRTKLLEKACGREGVQSLLIERALPEIEDDTNELLDRLTGGQMQVIFDTQRKLKSSDRVAETLDIRIADNAGERPYENFSGGEQFRINFAIRLALSKILTKRAGARLQTLVIDEGFGSQDPEGRQRLIEAINVIQDDFERILVITHIDEMRNVFPAQIFVEKGTLGSTIQVT